MSDRGEHVRLFATFLNTAASGGLLGVIVTLPLAAFSSDRMSPFQQTTLELIFAGVAVLLAGALEVRMTLVPALLAPVLILLVAVGGLLIFHFTDRHAKRDQTGPSRKVGGETFAKPPTRARRKML